MAVICSALHTQFTPAVGTFKVQVHGEARLLRKYEGSALFSPVEDIRSRAFVCVNDTAGTVYVFEPILGSGQPPVIEAAQ